MIAVQTLNLHKYYSSNDISSIRLQLTMALLSSYLLKKYKLDSQNIELGLSSHF